MEHVAFFIFLAIILVLAFSFGKAGQDSSECTRKVAQAQDGRFENDNIIIIDDRKIFKCPLNEQWAGDTVRVNSGYCRSACKRRNYTVKSPGDYFVACNK
jgi:hypothetical protein